MSVGGQHGGEIGRRSARSIGGAAFLALLASPGLALACTLAATPIDHVPAWLAPPADMALPANAPALVWSPALELGGRVDEITGAPSVDPSPEPPRLTMVDAATDADVPLTAEPLEPIGRWRLLRLGKPLVPGKSYAVRGGGIVPPDGGEAAYLLHAVQPAPLPTRTGKLRLARAERRERYTAAVACGDTGPAVLLDIALELDRALVPFLPVTGLHLLLDGQEVGGFPIGAAARTPDHVAHFHIHARCDGEKEPGWNAAPSVQPGRYPVAIMAAIAGHPVPLVAATGELTIRCDARSSLRPAEGVLFTTHGDAGDVLVPAAVLLGASAALGAVLWRVKRKPRKEAVAA